MAVKYLIAAVVAAALLVGAVGAVGAAPADHAQTANDSDATDAADLPDESDVGEVGPNDAPAPGDLEDGEVTVGPSDGLPEQAPEFVSEIHETVESFLDGEIDNLGETLQRLLGGAPAE